MPQFLPIKKFRWGLDLPKGFGIMMVRRGRAGEKVMTGTQAREGVQTQTWDEAIRDHRGDATTVGNMVLSTGEFKASTTVA
jgi:hypothetical protein